MDRKLTPGGSWIPAAEVESRISDLRSSEGIGFRFCQNFGNKIRRNLKPTTSRIDRSEENGRWACVISWNFDLFSWKDEKISSSVLSSWLKNRNIRDEYRTIWRLFLIQIQTLQSNVITTYDHSKHREILSSFSCLHACEDFSNIYFR